MGSGLPQGFWLPGQERNDVPQFTGAEWVPKSMAQIAAQLDHGTLLGLVDDDHTIYLKADGTRNLTGNLAASAGVTFDGVDVGAHAHTGAGSNGPQVAHASLSGIGANDHHNQAHGASDHTDRTRRVWLPAKSFIDGLNGTPAYQTTGTANVSFDNWALDGTADESVNIVMQMPADWDLGNVTPSIFWAPSDTNTGNVNWVVRITSIASGEAMNSALESTSGAQTSAASGTQYALTVKNMGAVAPGTGTASPLLRILVYRFSSDAADTYNAHDALFVGMMLEYQADM